MDDVSVRENDLAALEDEESLVTERARFVLAARASDGQEDVPSRIGTAKAIRRTTDEIIEQIASPDSDGECLHCELALPKTGPPMCLRCGEPY